MIDKRCRVRNYIREVRWYIYTSLRGQVRAVHTRSYNNASGQCRDKDPITGQEHDTIFIIINKFIK